MPSALDKLRARGAVEGAFDQIFRQKVLWDSTNSSSQVLVARLINTLTELTHVGGAEWQQLSDGLDTAVEVRLLQRVQDTHAALKDVHATLEERCTAMIASSAEVRQVHEGWVSMLGAEAARSQPLFATSAVEDFGERAGARHLRAPQTGRSLCSHWRSLAFALLLFVRVRQHCSRRRWPTCSARSSRSRPPSSMTCRCAATAIRHASMLPAGRCSPTLVRAAAVRAPARTRWLTEHRLRAAF